MYMSMSKLNIVSVVAMTLTVTDIGSRYVTRCIEMLESVVAVYYRRFSRKCRLLVASVICDSVSMRCECEARRSSAK